MKHRIGFNRLERRQGHRKALKNNMVTSLFRYERVETTKAKAQEIRRVAEKLVTRARVDSVHNRRIVGERIHDNEILAKLFTDIAPRYLERPGGYTRILKIGRRQGDAAEMVILELVDRVVEEKTKTRAEKQRPEEREAPAAAEEVTENEEPVASAAPSQATADGRETAVDQPAKETEDVSQETEDASQATEVEEGAESAAEAEATEEPDAGEKDEESKGGGASE